MSFWRRLSARTPLRVKLVAALLALVALALTVISVASVSIMRGYLIDRIDGQLVDVAQTAARQVQLRGCPRVSGISDYVLEVRNADGAEVCNPLLPMRQTDVPAVPADPEVLEQRGPNPFTVGSVRGDTQWRVVAVPFQNGSLVVGRSMYEVNHTLTRLAGAELVVGSIVIVLLAGLGIAIVRASLRSLVKIEHTAAAIAAGDLSRRVPDADPRTEVGRLGNALNGMLTQIERAFHARAQSEATARRSEERMRRFVADASHELRTPLSVIRGFAEYYRQRDDVGQEELDRLIGRVEDEATRMGVLVEDLLMLARLDQQRPLALHPVDLLALAADAVQDARVLAPDRDISLTVRGDSAFIVTGDDVRLRQVIGNLMNNALRYTPEGSPIEVIVRSARVGGGPPSAILEVADQGPGLPPEQAERVFERFYRADPARTREAGGTGLGLAIVDGLVRAHGGTVEVETAPGQGATFRVILPLAPDVIDAEDSSDAGTPTPGAP